ncbi:MAG: cupin domain-containing protein [Bacillota bacterium]
MSLGNRIRQTRTQKGITLQELSDRSGLSKGFICQLENDKASPSLQALERLSSSLGVPIAFLFLSDEEKIHVVRSNERQGYSVGGDGLNVQFLSARGRHLKMMMIELAPGASTGGDNHAHEGEECHLVVEGTIRYVQGAETVVLKAGDSLHWNGYIPHRVENCGTTVARLLCVTSGSMEHMLECQECDDQEIPRQVVLEEAP